MKRYNTILHCFTHWTILMQILCIYSNAMLKHWYANHQIDVVKVKKMDKAVKLIQDYRMRFEWVNSKFILFFMCLGLFWCMKHQKHSHSHSSLYIREERSSFGCSHQRRRHRRSCASMWSYTLHALLSSAIDASNCTPCGGLKPR